MLTMTRTVIIRHTQMRALLQLWEEMINLTQLSCITSTIIEINVIPVHKVFDAHRLYSTLDLLCREGVRSVWGTMGPFPRSTSDTSTHPVDTPIQIDQSIGTTH